MAITGADVMQVFQPVHFGGLKFAFAIDNAHVNFQPVFVFKQFLDAVIQFKVGANQPEAFTAVFDEFFKVIGCGAGVEEFGHRFSLSEVICATSILVVRSAGRRCFTECFFGMV